MLKRARWSNGCSYAVEFEFFPDDREVSLSNALAALDEFQANIADHASGNGQYSIIAYLHVQWGKKAWGNPTRIHFASSEALGQYSWSAPVSVKIIPHGLAVDHAVVITHWPLVFPLMVNVLSHAKSLGQLLGGLSDELKLQSDLSEWDGEIRETGL